MTRHECCPWWTDGDFLYNCCGAGFLPLSFFWTCNECMATLRCDVDTQLEGMRMQRNHDYLSEYLDRGSERLGHGLVMVVFRFRNQMNPPSSTLYLEYMLLTT